MGYGRADASDGRVFPYVFTLPATYWAGADAMIQSVEDQEGGDLSGKKIPLVYFDGAYGKEPIRKLARLAQEGGITFSGFQVASPGNEQHRDRATGGESEGRCGEMSADAGRSN